MTHARTKRRELADERYQRRAERDLRRAEIKVAAEAARAKRVMELRVAKKAKRAAVAEQRRLREGLRIIKAVAKATKKMRREVVVELNATPRPRQPSLKRLNREALERRCAAGRAERRAREALPKVPPLPY